ncbi:MAG: DUF3795 domain-containing protein [Bacteroidales bacterium]|nr:DUF3795 domain-containing protein [Bacteroidales bacterium]
MNDLIAFCGLNCEKCEARIATVTNDNILREQVSRKWCEMNNTDQITPETINCMGCRGTGVKFYYCSHLCEIRKCAVEKEYGSCGECPEKHSCTKLNAILENNEEAKRNLQDNL